MEKQQDVGAILNTINNLTIKDAEEEFEDIILPSNSSFVPVSTNAKTIKPTVS